ncbi:hypothetical protein [Rhizobium sp. S163]|uniref:hypothetical protein n=1 Tax=Rhizobium sp. S163 TaxID=3055039 RepID=UPI0025A9EA81|nr:hypothetical protein [Rhizobium sp. S163]MDM9644840.1 hypothetical protein [Rhizobium sp. S163]
MADEYTQQDDVDVGLWLELIGGGHLTDKRIVDGLKPDDTTNLPTPKTRRKIRQRLQG